MNKKQWILILFVISVAIANLCMAIEYAKKVEPTVREELEVRFAVNFSLFCEELAQDIGAYNSEDWRRLHEYGYFLVSLTNLNGLGVESDLNDLIYELDRLLVRLERGEEKLPDDVQEKLLQLSVSQADEELVTEVLEDILDIQVAS